MTVKELIEHLNTFNPETRVMFSHTDHTDWLSKGDFSPENVYLGDPLSEDSEEIDDDLYDDEWNYIGPQVLLFEVTID